MSLFSPRHEGSVRRAPVTGKISIGVPTDEVILVPNDPSKLIGVKLKTEQAGVPAGIPMKDRHVEAILRSGLREIAVTHGNFPSRLDYFRVLRRSDIDRSQFVADPEVNRRYGLSESPRTIPIVLPVNDIEKMASGGMRNYDRRNERMFCSASEPPKARRAAVAGGQYTGAYNEVECVPTYEYAALWGKPICPFRNKDAKQGKLLPCKANYVFYFNILTTDVEAFDLGSFFKFETSSIESGRNIQSALEEVRDRFGRIDWIPMELQIFEREKATGQGGIRSKVPIVTLTVPTKLMMKYQSTIDSVRQLIDAYSISQDVRIDDVVNEEAYDAEFRPEVRKQLMEESMTYVPEEVSLVSGIDSAVLASLDAQAMQLPVDQFNNYLSKRDSITDETVGDFRSHIHGLLGDLDEAEKVANFDINSQRPVVQ